MTKVSSMGMWVPVHRDEWDSETSLEAGTPAMDSEPGEVAFGGGALPWKTGIYEVRRFYVNFFFPIQLASDPLSSRREVQRHGHHKADRNIRSVCNHCSGHILAVILTLSLDS